MRKGIGVSIAIAAVMVATFGAPASATHGGPHPTFREEANFFECMAGNRIQNVGRLNGQMPTWSTTAPTQALTAGGGCVQYENLLTTTDSVTGPYDLAFTGTSTGNLKTVSIDMYFQNTPQASVPEYLANANLLIDGEVVHTATQFTFPVATEGDLKKLTYHYTRLDKRFATEDGDGTQEREITIALSSYNEEQMLFLWGATDAASKITFNAAATPGTKLLV